MNDNGKVIARSTIVPLKPGDYDVKDNQQRMNEQVDTTIHQSIGDYQNALNEDYTDTPDVGNNNIQEQLEFCFNLKRDETDDNDIKTTTKDTDCPDVDDAGSDIESEAFDKFLGLHINLPGQDGESMVLGKVKERKRDHDGALIGSSNPNACSSLGTSSWSLPSAHALPFVLPHRFLVTNAITFSDLSICS